MHISADPLAGWSPLSGMSTIRAAFHVKNVPVWERVLRVAAAAAAVALAVVLAAPWSWVAAASAVGLVATGLVGFCPACALVGRRLSK